MGIAPRVPTVNVSDVASEMVGQAVEMRKNLSCGYNTGMLRTMRVLPRRRCRRRNGAEVAWGMELKA